VRELNRERLERVTLRHVVFDAHLELFLGESVASNSFKFIVGHRCREQVRKFAVPLRSKVVIIPTNRTDFVSQDSFKHLLFLSDVHARRGHEMADAS
jgi:hypothetical protein